MSEKLKKTTAEPIFDPIENMWKCPLCKAKYRKRQAVSNHLRWHSIKTGVGVDSKMINRTFSIGKRDNAFITRLITEGVYPSRSEFIRLAVKNQIVREILHGEALRNFKKFEMEEVARRYGIDFRVYRYIMEGLLRE